MHIGSSKRIIKGAAAAVMVAAIGVSVPFTAMAGSAPAAHRQEAIMPESLHRLQAGIIAHRNYTSGRE